MNAVQFVDSGTELFAQGVQRFFGDKPAATRSIDYIPLGNDKKGS